MTHLQEAIKTSVQAKAVAKDILTQLKRGSQTASTIAKVTRIDKGNTARWLTMLTEDGWAEKIGLTDSRVILWAITPAGRQALEIL